MSRKWWKASALAVSMILSSSWMTEGTFSTAATLIKVRAVMGGPSPSCKKSM
jgi:hypothetical protein